LAEVALSPVAVGALLVAGVFATGPAGVAVADSAILGFVVFCVVVVFFSYNRVWIFGDDSCEFPDVDKRESSARVKSQQAMEMCGARAA
jgi:hypothetical protein